MCYVLNQRMSQTSTAMPVAQPCNGNWYLEPSIKFFAIQPYRAGPVNEVKTIFYKEERKKVLIPTKRSEKTKKKSVLRTIKTQS